MTKFPVKTVDRMPVSDPRKAVQPQKGFPVRYCRERTYYPYQNDYHEWSWKQLLKGQDSIACFMEMRLGKTLPTIRITRDWAETELAFKNSCCPVLVVAPMSVLATWERELRLEGENCVVVHGSAFDKRVVIAASVFEQPGRTWVLINYDSLRATPGLSDFPWYTVILDESTIIKNPKAKISELCTRKFKNAKHRLILTGLPSPEGELDLAQQFIFLHGHFMGCKSYWEYRNKYFELKFDGWQPKTYKPCPSCIQFGQSVIDADPDCEQCDGKGFVPFPAATMIKDYVHDHAFVLTRQEAGIGSKKIREVRFVTMTKDQTEVYNRVEREYVFQLGENGSGFDEELETDHVITQRVWLARIAGGCDALGAYKWAPKVTELVSLLKGELSNQPVVVGFRFDAEIQAVAKALNHVGIAFVTLTGSDSREERKRKQDWFATSQVKGRVILVQIKKVAQYGVDMSVSSTMIFYSVTYSGEEMSQFEDRIVHPDKKEPLLYISLITEDTIDQDAHEAMGEKVRNAKMFMRRLKKIFMNRVENKTFKTKRTIKKAV